MENLIAILVLAFLSSRIALQTRGDATPDYKSGLAGLEPKYYNDYLRAALELYGDKAKEMSDSLTEILIENNHLNLSKEKVLADLSNFEILLKRQALEQSLVSEKKKITIYDIDKMSPYEFEKAVAKIYELKGYTTTLTKASGDQGADIILEKFGHKIAIQVKLYSTPVGNKAVQEIVAAKYHYGANKAMVVTNNYFTSSAKELAKSNGVQLIDRSVLSEIFNSNLM